MAESARLLKSQEHDIPWMLRQIRAAVRPYPKAALFELAEEGFDTPFEQLVACMISARTRDEVTLPTAKALLSRARTPKALARLSAGEIDRLIQDSTFHEVKARRIREIALEVENRHGGKLPCDPETLLALPGVGPKTANLVLGIACDQPRVGVDVHVHRVTKRWGYIEASTPEKATLELEGKLPHRYWVEINALLVPFGKHLCTRLLPKCSTCPVLSMCRQIGVTSHR